MNHSTGQRCGYVGIKPTHPLYGLPYNDTIPQTLMDKWQEIQDKLVGKRGAIDLFILSSNLKNPRIGILFDVHGGITYSSKSPDYPIFIKDTWWFGFDCSHYGDGKDIGQIYPEDVRRHYHNFPGDVIRTLEYCISECESLSQQLTDIGGK